MNSHQSRRKFLQAGVALPAAGLVSSGGLDSAFQGSSSAPKVVYRTLGKTNLKVSGVGYGIGFVPVADVVARAIDMGINYFDTCSIQCPNGVQVQDRLIRAQQLLA